MRDVIFIQSRFPLQEQELSVLLNRWEGYGLALSRLVSQGSITIISLDRKFIPVNDYGHLEFLSHSSGFFGNLLRARQRIQTSGQSATLVCGDNQFSLLFALLLKLRLNSKISIQTQFHGDIYSSGVQSGLKAIIRTLTSRIAMMSSNSIRVVSKFQEFEIKELMPEIRAKFVISPIPIDFSKIPLATEFTSGFDLAFIGRLHYERGVDEAVSIMKELVSARPTMRIVIVGAGPESDFLNIQLRNEISSGCVVLVGALYGNSLRRIYAQSKILLSTAPREGYGLTLREAVLSGISVVARTSLGAKEASINFPTRFHFYNSENEAVEEVLGILDSDNRLMDNSDLIAFQQESDKDSLNRLLASWVND